jgi:hypothetical protein
MLMGNLDKHQKPRVLKRRIRKVIKLAKKLAIGKKRIYSHLKGGEKDKNYSLF